MLRNRTGIASRDSLSKAHGLQPVGFNQRTTVHIPAAQTSIASIALLVLTLVISFNGNAVYQAPVGERKGQANTEQPRAPRAKSVPPAPPSKPLTPEDETRLREAEELGKQVLKLFQSGKYAQALPLAQRALDIRRKALGEAHPDYAVSLHNLAALYSSMGEYAKAEALSVQARDVFQKVLGEGDPHYATSLNNLAVLYQSMGEYAKAETLLVQVRDICKRVFGEQHRDYAASLNNLALLYKSVGEYAKAETLLVQARDICKRVLGEQHPDYAVSLHNLAALYDSMAEYAKAEPLCVEARDVFQKVLGEGHPHYATSLNNLAVLYQSMGEYAKAEPLLVQARDIRKKVLGEAHPDYALSLSNLASLYYLMAEYAKAEPLAREQLRLETAFAVRVLAFLSEARATTFQAKQLGCDPLLGVLRKMPAASGTDACGSLWTTRALVSRSLMQTRRVIASTPKAEQVLRELQSTAQQLAQLTLAVPKPEQREARQRRLAELNDEKERLEEELARVSQEFRRSREVADAKPADLARLLPRDTTVVEFYRARVWNPPKGGKGRLVTEAVYDAFVLRAGNVPAGMSVAWVQLGPAEPIDDAAAAWRAAIMGRPHPNPLPKGEGTNASSLPKGEATKGLPLPLAGEGRGEGASQPERFLRQKLWDKIEPHLAGCSTVIIIPDGDLCFLPWPALPGREPGTCLLEDYAIATAPSGHQLYAMLTEPRSTGGKMLLAGAVSYDAQPVGPAVPASPTVAKQAADKAGPTDVLLTERTRSPAIKTKTAWVALPGTEKEIDEIRSLWAAKSAPVTLRGAAASEQSLCQHLPGSRYVHLATHGFFADPEFRSMFGHDVGGEQLFGQMEGLVSAQRARVTVRNPLILSGIVLAGANLPPKTDNLGLPTGEDGILTAEEIVNLDLRGTELVVLSACDTGLGKVAGGEGVMGLTRAFHVAGARNVVASLWKVDDQATAALMRLFYYKLWKEQKPPIVALREAQLYLYRNPDQIGQLAAARGFDFSKTAPLPEGGRKVPTQSTAPPRLWAAFILSGPGK